MKIFAAILLLIIQVKTQDLITDITASGDGDGLILTTRYASLIDENGDLENITDIDTIKDFSSMENETIPDSFSNESTTLKFTTREESTSTTTTVATTMVIAVTNDSRPTEESTVMTTRESSTTTDFPSTTTLSTTEAITTTTTIKTTDKPTTKTTTTTSASTVSESYQTSIISSRASTERTTYLPTNQEKFCSLVDSSLMCEEEIFCYGEGTIDCSEDIDNHLAETIFKEKKSLPSSSEDYPEYESVEEGIETFPPYLVGVKSSRIHPFLFRMGSLETTETNFDNSKDVEEKQTETFTSAAPTFSSNFQTNKELANEETTKELKVTVANAEIRDVNSDMTLKENIKESTPIPSTPTPVFNINTFPEESEKHLSTSDGISNDTTTTDEVTTVENVTNANITTETFSSLDKKEESANVRRKREESIASSSSKGISFNVASMENSRKTSTKACRLTGNLICTPSPTKANCRGKALCQVLTSTAETSEKATSTKGVENWAIAVIAICAIAAALTVSLLIYLVFTSWKKLKVQPQNGVTTLTYVNSSIP